MNALRFALAITHATRDATVIIRDGRFAAIGNGPPPADANIVDGRESF
ncbi:MAG TPA: hypothetical protein VL284_04590 [Thermoanaerobaculia bacterium]|nr:hypothetical protein [Thermoanaerobaculia bacterium]